MAESFATTNKRMFNFSRHKGFFTLVFISFAVIFILITYSAVQQQQQTKSRAGGGPDNVCALVDQQYCSGKTLDTCFGQSNGCCKTSGNNCVKDNDIVVPCSRFNFENHCKNGVFGIAVNMLCEWDDTNGCLYKGRSGGTPSSVAGKCVDKTPPVAGRCVDKISVTPKPPENKDIQLQLWISLQGITKSYPPKLTQDSISARVILVDERNGKKEKDGVIFKVNENRNWIGTAEFKDIDISRRYYILIKPAKHVQKKICNPKPQDPSSPGPGYYSCAFGQFVDLKEGLNKFDFTGARILAGDLPIDKNANLSNKQNGTIDAEDLATLKNIIDKEDSEVTDEDRKIADLDLNGLVEAHDWSLMIESLEVKYDEK
jgi:hypothetical protein